MQVVTLPGTGRPKRDIIEIAFDDCGLAGYEFDRTPEEQSIALRKLNAMMMEPPWNKLGYAQPTYGVGQVEQPSGLPDDAISAVAQYLALRIAPGIGVTLSPEQRATLARSMAGLRARVAASNVPSMTIPGNTPRGAGRRFLPEYPFFGRTDATPALPEPAAVDDLQWSGTEW